MPSFSLFGESTTQQQLDALQAGVVTSTGSLLVMGDSAVNMTGFAFLNVSGSVFASVSGVTSTVGGFVTVGTTGMIVGSGDGLNFAGTGSSSTVNNSGAIFGGTGIRIDAGSAVITNRGQITGDSAQGISFGGTSSLRLTNSGDIFGATYGVQAVGSTVTSISNTGIISGGTGAMALSNGVSRVVNTGLIDGVTLLAGGADVFNGTLGVQGDVLGGAGIDSISGGAAQDRLFGGADADVIHGNGADDLLNGGDANDVLFGGAGDDNLIGEIGLDTLRGGDGDDRLSGGTLADTFVFTRNQGTDVIVDFQNNIDKLDLRAFDFASVAAVTAVASAATLGLRIDLPGEGMLFVRGLTLAQLDGTDLLL